MTHTDWERQREQLSAYLDGALTPREEAELQAHLATCAECQRELAALTRTRALLRALPTPTPPRSFTLPADAPGVVALRRAPAPWTRPVQALGGVAAMIGLGILITTSLPHPGFGASAGASMAPATQHTDAGAATSVTPERTASQVQSSGDNASPAPAIAVTPTVTATPTYSPYTGSQHTGQAFPVGPVSGGVLLVGGAAALAVGSLARRRRQ